MSKTEGRVPLPVRGGCQSITTSGTSARTSSALGDQSRKVLIAATEGAHYVFGGSGAVATSADTYIPGGGEHFVRIRPGSHVAAIQASTAGTVYVSEMDD